MKAKLKVLVPFTDKNDRTVRYKEGDTVSFDDIERVNDLVARKVCRLEAFEAEKPETAAANEIAVGDKSYPLAAVKVAKPSASPFRRMRVFRPSARPSQG